MAVLVTIQPVAAQETGWIIERFHAEIVIQPDASLRIVESIDVDFGALTDRHGIFRYVPVQYDYDAKHYRVYQLEVESVTDAAGKPWKYERSRTGPNVVLKIGDADTIVTGKQTYRIAYRVRGALNAFPDHDELFWNVDGDDWPVPKQSVSATVLLPSGGLGQATCFQGHNSSLPCDVTPGEDRVEYAATRPLRSGEELTVVAGIRKGDIAPPPLFLEDKPRTFAEYFEVNGATVAATALLLLGGVAFVSANWWARGRDRRYTSLYYLTENPAEETRPLFKRDPIVVEYQPPEGLRPAQMGLLLDERADPKDATATIVDLAVRGYLTIAEVPKEGFFKKLFGKQDWTLTRKRQDSEGLEQYESIIFNGLFTSGDEVKLSALKNKFHTTLSRAQKVLYADATRQKWFAGNPDTVRSTWAVIGVVVMVAGAGLIYALGRFFGAGIAGFPVVVAGIILLVTHNWMPRRTARGSELLRRTLGFREYIDTAEKNQQQFNERANIFAEYLPYAIVFGSVDRWARAFRGIDTAAATAAFYYGTSGFDSIGFSRGMESFSSSISSTITSTPGSSGGSGFSGGSSGGGGGGGGGGSW